jgi:hypothetical protein
MDSGELSQLRHPTLADAESFFLNKEWLAQCADN